ncbi:MAG: hypothetical protein IJJ33_03075 [Victivallales bacterium]|nr:hypothetical protein [Victivallales bacterium]
MSAIHPEIGRRAFESLPADEQEFWESVRHELPGHCDLPDLHLASQWDNSGKEAWYARYDVLPNGRCTPHGPVDPNWVSAALGGLPDASKSLYALRYFMKKTTERIRKRDVAEAARFSGSLAHMIQDCSTPGHVMNNITLNHLFPARGGKLVPLHSTIDFWPLPPCGVKPKPALLGRSVEEAAFLLNETLLRNAEAMSGDIVPLCQAIQRGQKKAVDRIMRKWNGESVRLTASAWHTVFSLAHRRIPAEQQRRFSALDLTRLPMVHEISPKFDRRKFIASGIPFYDCIYPECDPARSRLSTDRIPFEPAVNTSYDGNGTAIPSALLSGGKRVGGHSIAAGSYGVASFRVPGKLYSEFDVLAGVHPDSESAAEVTFAVWCPEADNPLLAIGKASKEADALHFRVRLPRQCHTLCLLSAGGNSRLSVVWLNPTLFAAN